MDKSTKEYIHKVYTELLAKMEGGKLYGGPIDTNDREVMTVAAYFMGKNEMIDERLKEHAG